MIQVIKKIASSILPELIAVRRHLHAQPELSFQEFHTASFVFSQLEKMGLQPTYLTETGIVALIQGKPGDKVIALRADLDALPITEQTGVAYASQNKGIMHACGHDVHTASLLGAAMILTSIKDRFSGTIKLIFQPGEEKLPGGASLMIKEGVLQNPAPKAILGQHVFPELESGKVGFRSGKYMASCDEVYLTVRGKGGHGALPHTVVDPIAIAAHTIIALQQIVARKSNPMTPTVLSFGRIEGLGATNVIPSTVQIEGTFRTFDEEWRFQAHEHIKEIASSTALAFGGECEVNIQLGYPFVYNHPELTDRAINAARMFIGDDNVVDLDMRPTGEDFSFYGQHIPATFYRLGVGNKAKGIVHPVHSPMFDADENALEIGAGLMTYLAVNELNNE